MFIYISLQKHGLFSDFEEIGWFYIECSSLRVWDGGLEDVQHAVTRLVPGLWGEFLSIQDDNIL